MVKTRRVTAPQYVLRFFGPPLDVQERRSRAAFLRQQAQAVGVEGLGNTAEQLGMPLSEVMQVRSLGWPLHPGWGVGVCMHCAALK